MNRPMPIFTEKHVARFWKRVSKGTPDECWEWQSYTTGSLGYGSFKAFCKSWNAHRVAYYLHHNEDPGELCVCHTCDNPKCCNPKHLWLGTCVDNNRDTHKKGRHSTNPPMTGIEQPNAKLTNKKVREIRKLHAAKKYTLTQLAERYSVSIVAIHYVMKRITWKHVK